MENELECTSHFRWLNKYSYPNFVDDCGLKYNPIQEGRLDTGRPSVIIVAMLRWRHAAMAQFGYGSFGASITGYSPERAFRNSTIAA